MRKKYILIWVLLFSFLFNKVIVVAQITKYPDYSYEYLGEDKLEKFNRKMFNFNLGLNKYAIRPIDILWSSIMPVYGMDRIYGISNNIEYPIRLVSSLLQKDFKTSKNETIRFFTNTIIGLGGMFDPAKHIFKIEQANENMEQALAGCKMETGKYFVFPVLSFTSFRGLLGRILDTALNPGSYIASPVIAAVKAVLSINRTAFMQPLISMVESTFADPYDIAKKIYGVETYMKCNNIDREKISTPLFIPYNKELVEKPKEEKTKEVVLKKEEPQNVTKIEVSSIIIPNLLYGGASLEGLSKNYGAEEFKLTPDIILQGYNPQNPVVDSVRTALFDIPEVKKSMWNEMSVWNRCFANQIKEDKINLYEGRADYSYKYILQKDKKNNKVAIIFPSIGEGVTSTHSVLFAKLFYDAGYSIVILGSHFQWEFAKSMPKNYYPGLPRQDAEQMELLTLKVLNKISEKYGCNFENKVVLGTSFGAIMALFLGDREYKNNRLGNLYIISICPPVNLLYAMKQVDKNTQDWQNSTEPIKKKVAQISSKIVQIYKNKDDIKTEINNLPFSEEDGKLITGFLMHQKLSDLIFTLDNPQKDKFEEEYKKINDMNFQDYVAQYILSNNDKSIDELDYEASLNSISDYLEHSNNYKIYHSVNDYLTNPTQLKMLKQFAQNKLVLFNNGAHLGFMYRNEFVEELKQAITVIPIFKTSLNVVDEVNKLLSY